MKPIVDTTARTVYQGMDYYDEFYRFDNKQVITVTAPTSGTTGTFKAVFKNVTSPPIDKGASAATLQGTLEAMSSIGGGNVSVTGSAGGPWTVEFLRSLAVELQPLMTINWYFNKTDASVSVGYVSRDLTSYTAVCKVRDTPGGATALTSLTESSSSEGQVIIDASHGHVTIYIKASETATYTFTTPFLIELQLTAPSSGPVEIWMQAQLTLVKSIVP